MNVDRILSAAPRSRMVRAALLGLAALVLGSLFLATYAVTVRTLAGQRLDNGAFVSWQQLNPFLGAFAQVLRPTLPLALGAVCCVLGLGALRARRVRALVRATLVVGITVPVSRWLRDAVLERPDLADLGYAYNTLPSGHVVASSALCVAVLLLWPRLSWPLVLWAGGVLLAASIASLLEHAHRPSDVVASLLLVGTVTCLVLALTQSPAPRTAGPGNSPGPPSS